MRFSKCLVHVYMLVLCLFFSVQYGCQASIRIPVVDDDGDAVRCRWSVGSECVSICNVLPSAHLDSVRVMD